MIQCPCPTSNSSPPAMPRHPTSHGPKHGGAVNSNVAHTHSLFLSANACRCYQSNEVHRAREQVPQQYDIPNLLWLERDLLLGAQQNGKHQMNLCRGQLVTIHNYRVQLFLVSKVAHNDRTKPKINTRSFYNSHCEVNRTCLSSSYGDKDK